MQKANRTKVADSQPRQRKHVLLRDIGDSNSKRQRTRNDKRAARVAKRSWPAD